MPRKIEISHRTIIFTVLFLLSLGFLYVIRDLILELFVALLIMTIFNPLVTKLSKLKIPRGISVFIVYLLLFGLLGVVIAVIIPPLIEQTTSFTANLPQYLNSLGINEIMSEQIISQLFSQIGSLPTQALRFGVSVFSNILGLVSVLIFAFYLLLAREKLDDQLGFLFGEGKRKEIAQVLNILEAKLGGWARGQMALMLLVGLLTYIGLTILGIPFALPLAILAGLLEIIPYIGPIFAAIQSVVIGLSISPLMGLATIALAFLANQVENYLFVPKVMEKSVGVSPIVTLLALAIGFRLAGVIGIIISIPLVLTIQTLSKIYLFSSK